MPPIRFQLPCQPLIAGFGSAEIKNAPMPRGASLLIRAVRTPADRTAAGLLASCCRTADPAFAGRLAPRGIAAELTSRAGRAVHAWLAEGGTGAVKPCPLGMLSLVETGSRPRVRFSVAWLIVHPDARRQGIATALVRRAAAHVAAGGGHEFFAETLPSWPAASSFWKSLANAAGSPVPHSGLAHA